VGGYLFVTIDHGGGLSSTYSWVSQIHVRKGDVVSRGQTIGLTGTGHPGSGVPALHLGVKLNDVYVDPLDYLEPLNVSGLIRLASLVPGPI
jgi:murein DD-endopeptidase MepM/ murein hydrolase activator NlpD